MSRRVVVEADGGSRGNPGAAAYGALLRDPESGRVLAQTAETIGIASNNVAEYRGLIAGLELAREHAPGAAIEVRMDSKLVVEQMSGRWKIRHEDMKRLALEARRLAPPDTVYTWVRREENTAADALANAALDGRDVPTHPVDPDVSVDPLAEADAPAPAQGWGVAADVASTTLVLIRHGATDLTLRKIFSGCRGDDPPLNEIGREQAARAAAYAVAHYEIDAVVSSPVRRARQTAERVAAAVGVEATTDERMREADFGDWEGHTFAEIAERWPSELKDWLASSAVAPPGGESFDQVSARALAARDALLERFAGQTVAVVSHVGPIKLLVRAALGAPTEAIYRMELAPASFSTVQFWADGNASLRELSVVPR